MIQRRYRAHRRCSRRRGSRRRGPAALSAGLRTGLRTRLVVVSFGRNSSSLRSTFLPFHSKATRSIVETHQLEIAHLVAGVIAALHGVRRRAQQNHRARQSPSVRDSSGARASPAPARAWEAPLPRWDCGLSKTASCPRHRYTRRAPRLSPRAEPGGASTAFAATLRCSTARSRACASSQFARRIQTKAPARASSARFNNTSRRFKTRLLRSSFPAVDFSGTKRRGTTPETVRRTATVFSLAFEESTRRSLVATSSGSACSAASRFTS